jgi:hypothetical protein
MLPTGHRHEPVFSCHLNHKFILLLPAVSAFAKLVNGIGKPLVKRQLPDE